MKRAAGFSLIEVMCAVAILGVALVGLTRGFTTGLVASKESERQSTASLIAAGRIEALRADGFVVEGTDEGEMTGDLSSYRWRQEVTETEIRGLFDVVVRVEHIPSESHLFELRTMLFDPPIDLIPESERPEERQDGDRKNERRAR
ncbi:MAG TPA: hypothetical protein DCY13_10430 [Verrucomicrobiales bacterium]|nr:hypothetical protein [Verrucomicrobiales bacterium]